MPQVPSRATPRQIKRFGWIPDIPDFRDYPYAAPLATLSKVPRHVDLRPQCPAVCDQGQLGSCTANAIAGAIEFDQMKQKLATIFVPSRLFIYYNERVMEGTTDHDSGARIRDGIKSVAKQGDCPETEWPYLPAKFATEPPSKCYQDALANLVTSYQRLTANLTQMKSCLADGYPFVFGFTVYDSFMTPEVEKTGHAPLPGPTEQVVGGHAVMAVGYDDAHQWFIARNSWGDGWGMKGYFTLPYSYLLQSGLASDFWTIRTVA
jgi:C1A family cysteine protease